jgi:hypothetical protein
MKISYREATKMIKHFLLFIYLLASIVWVSACSETNAPVAVSGNFDADVSGAFKGKVSGPGVIKYLPPSEVSFGSRPGYFFIADATGVRDFGIIFTIPANTTPGTYPLKTAHPMDVGKGFEVRLDKSTDNRTVSFQSNTTGSITLEEFPEDPNNITDAIVKGTFKFSTENSNAERVNAEGVFEFQGR